MMHILNDRHTTSLPNYFYSSEIALAVHKRTAKTVFIFRDLMDEKQRMYSEHSKVRAKSRKAASSDLKLDLNLLGVNMLCWRCQWPNKLSLAETGASGE